MEGGDEFGFYPASTVLESEKLGTFRIRETEMEVRMLNNEEGVGEDNREE